VRKTGIPERGFRSRERAQDLKRGRFAAAAAPSSYLASLLHLGLNPASADADESLRPFSTEGGEDGKATEPNVHFRCELVLADGTRRNRLIHLLEGDQMEMRD
jgi:hypothetical protein